MTAEDLLRAVFERYAAHQGLGGLHTDDLHIVGYPPEGWFDRETQTSAARGEALHAQGLSFSLRDVEEVGPDGAIFSAVWSAGPGGCAGIYWGAVRIRDGKLARLAYCASRDEAARALEP